MRPVVIKITMLREAIKVSRNAINVSRARCRVGEGGMFMFAFAEIFKWRQGLDQPLSSARYFYRIVIGSMFVGILMDFANINPVKALFWTAVINGLLAPFLLVGILIAASDHKIMNGQPSSMLSRAVVALATLVMFGAAIGMFVF